MRFDDVYPKEKTDKPKPPAAAPKPAAPKSARPSPPPAPPQDPAPPVAPPPKVTPPKAPPLPETPVALDVLYEQLVQCVRRIFDQIRTDKPLDIAEAIALIVKLPDTRTSERDTMLLLLPQHTEDSYLYGHSVNVAIMANHLGYCLGYPEVDIHELALAGLLLDIGMAGQAEQCAAQPRELTSEERQVIHQHPTLGVERLKTIQGVSQEVLDAVGAHHERNNGKGYPGQVHDAELGEYGKVLAVCDVYDAHTHPRSYRKRVNPAHAIKALVVEGGELFDQRIIKILMGELSLYPPSSLVKLNTGEIGVVERIRPEAPLRPVVLVTQDAQSNTLPTPRRVDLLEQPFTYIAAVVTEEDPRR